MLRRLEETGQFREIFWEPFTRCRCAADPAARARRDACERAPSPWCSRSLLGLILATGRLSTRSWLRRGSGVVVEFFRALPLVLLIFFAFLGLPRLGIDISAFGALVIGLTLYNGSVFAEIFRAGINAVPKGQSEAAYSIGLRKGAVMRMILVPQSVRIMLPAIVSQMVVLLKDSALGFIVAYPELLRSGRRIYTNIGNVIPTAIVDRGDLHHHQPRAHGRRDLRSSGGSARGRRRRGAVDVPVEIGVDLP